MTTPEILSALGPLGPLYEDADVLEIMVDAPDRILVERRGQLQEAGVRLESPEAFCQVIEAVLQLGGKALHAGQTLADVRLPDQARALAVLPPTAVHGPHLVIRKMSVQPLSWEKLLAYRAINPAGRDLLQSAISAHVNLLVSGGTGSGKTTLADRLAELISPEERLVVAENTHELRIAHPRAIFLEAGATGMPLNDLLTIAAKMRPDWLVIGELLGPEALHALEILGRGHSGLTTLHATSTEDALSRLESLCLMANLGLGIGEIRAAIAAALRVITHQARLSNGKRRILQITELAGLEGEHYVLQPLLRYNPGTDELEPTGIQPGWQA